MCNEARLIVAHRSQRFCGMTYSVLNMLVIHSFVVALQEEDTQDSKQYQVSCWPDDVIIHNLKPNAFIYQNT